MKKIITILILNSIVALNAQSKKERADEYFTDFKFDKAIDLYLELQDTKHNKDGYISKRLADSYFNIVDYTNAANWYYKLYRTEDRQIGESNIIKLVQSLKASGDLEEADIIIKEYYKDEKRLSMILKQKAILDSLEQLKEQYTIENMPFNSKKSDFAPAFYVDQLVFASSRDTTKSRNQLYDWNKQPYLDLYITQPKIKDYIPEKFLTNLESAYHDATIAYSGKSNNIYFTRNYFKKNKLNGNDEGISNMQILIGQVSQSSLIREEKLNFNDTNYSCAHPAITKDRRFLYFTSDMPGGYGGTDIYVVELSKEGYPFTPPMNLGPTINTPGREMFPFVDDDGLLYFSSDGHYGLGGLDIFVSQILSKVNYTLPENMGKPINSNMDDFSLIWSSDNEEGYFSSNRANGMGDDDIYRFAKVRPVDCLVYSGVVINKSNGVPLYNANVELYNENDRLVTFMKTDSEGFFKLILPCEQQNELIFSKTGFSKRRLVWLPIRICKMPQPGIKFT